MKDLLKTIILDQKKPIWNTTFLKRDYPERLTSSPQVVVISGIRRCGKSTLLHQIRSSSLEQDYFLNFDDERLFHFKVEDFQLLHETFLELFGKQNTFWFDEIQNVNGWERFVRRLHESGAKVYITGSNATMLSRELGTHLTGRYTGLELYPFSFSEFLSFYGINPNEQKYYSTEGKIELRRFYNDYFVTGGFPYYIRNRDESYLKSLYENILYRDVMARHKLVGGRELKELVFLLASNISRPFSNSRLASAVGIKNATTIKNYLDFLQDTYLLFAVNKFDYSARKQLQNARKIYFIDNAIILKLGFLFTEEKGRLLENIVFLELLRRDKEVFYFQGKGECDFLVRKGIKIAEAIQVCHSMNGADTKERELMGLLEAMSVYNLQEGIILTDDTAETIQQNDKKIRVMPVWKWLLK